MMRVITGAARGRKLASLPGTQTRPTSEAVKESIMSSVQFSIEGSRVLDLFAGTGQLGIEALSRGAESCIFVDSSPEAVTVIKENLKTTQLTAQGLVVSGEAGLWLSSFQGTLDLVFADPPYKFNQVDEILAQLVKHLSYDGRIMWESSREEALPLEVGDYVRHKEYLFGKKKVTQYRRKQAE